MRIDVNIVSDTHAVFLYIWQLVFRYFAASAICYFNFVSVLLVLFGYVARGAEG